MDIQPIKSTPFIEKGKTFQTIPSTRPPQEVIEEMDISTLQDPPSEQIEFMGQFLSAEDILKKFTSPSYLPKMLSPIKSTPKVRKTDETQH